MATGMGWAGSRLPMPGRRTLATGILPFARSMLTALRASRPPLVSNAGDRAWAAANLAFSRGD